MSERQLNYDDFLSATAALMSLASTSEGINELERIVVVE